jgi:hypothetical protein
MTDQSGAGGANKGTLGSAPPLTGESMGGEDEVARQASCLATPFVLRSQDDFRLAHFQQMQRLAQEREMVLQLR